MPRPTGHGATLTNGARPPVSTLALLFLDRSALGLIGWLTARCARRAFAGTAPQPAPFAARAIMAGMSRCGPSLPALLFLAIWASVSPGAGHRVGAARSRRRATCPPFGMERAAILSEARGARRRARSRPRSIRMRDALAPAYAAATSRYGLIGDGRWRCCSPSRAAPTPLPGSRPISARAPGSSGGDGRAAGRLAGRDPDDLGIVASLLFESVRFFAMVSPIDFLFGTHWSPQRDRPAPDPGASLGAVPLFWGTIFIGAIIAMIVAIPLGPDERDLPDAICQRPRSRSWMKPILEILAGVPTVVYGYFAALTVAPAVRDFAVSIGITSASSESALAAGLVMGVMIIPFVSSMADDSHRRGAAVDARRPPGDGRDAVGDDPQGAAARRAARHRRRRAARGQPRDRRDDDRGDGRGPRRQPDRQSLRQRDHGHHADRRSC